MTVSNRTLQQPTKFTRNKPKGVSHKHLRCRKRWLHKLRSKMLCCTCLGTITKWAHNPSCLGPFWSRVCSDKIWLWQARCCKQLWCTGRAHTSAQTRAWQQWWFRAWRSTKTPWVRPCAPADIMMIRLLRHSRVTGTAHVSPCGRGRCVHLPLPSPMCWCASVSTQHLGGGEDEEMDSLSCEFRVVLFAHLMW